MAVDIELELHALSSNAENSLAGCILIQPKEVIEAVRGLVSESDFYFDTPRAIFIAASSLLAAGKACDVILIQEEAEKLQKKVDAAYCVEVMDLTPTCANCEEYARIIHEEAQKRRCQEIGTNLQLEEISAVDAIAQLQDVLRGAGGSVKDPLELANYVMDYINSVASGEAQTYLPTGFNSLDKQLSGGQKGGLVNSGLITVAARPGTGKSTIALAIGENVVANGGKVLYISLEMTEIQLWSCRLAAHSGLSRSRIYDGMRGADEKAWKKLGDAFQALSTRQFYIRAIPSTVEDIEREARCIDGLSLLIVDHIGLVKATEQGSRYDKMTETSHRLKQLALSLKIPILALCQLNRQSEGRNDKRPTMADLRDSGAIEEDSDVVALLFRPAVYAKEEDRPKPWEAQELQVIVDKNRHGSTGTVYMNFCGMNSRIVEGQNARDDRLPD